MLSLGQLYLTDHPLMQNDPTQAWHYCYLAAKKNNATAITVLEQLAYDAQPNKKYQLASFYENQLKQKDKANFWYQYAAEEGHSKAQQKRKENKGLIAANTTKPTL
jgi:TPR repeat protein